MALYRPEPSWQKGEETNKKILNDPLAVIYNEGLWKVNKVSPMYNLQYDTVRLKQYASKLRQAIASTVTENSSIKYTVKWEAQTHLKYSEDDSDGLMITISSMRENSKTKIAYTAILLSWGVSSKLTDATHLPYLLERGEQKLGTIVKATLQTMFDCNIKQFSFSQYQLLQLGFNFLEHDTSKTDELFTLTYKTSPIDPKDKLNLSFVVEDVKIIWNGVQEEATSKSDMINLAYQVLQNQIGFMITLDITAFDLHEVGLPKAEVKSSGIIKMKSPEMVNCVFTLLNEISIAKSIKDLQNISG